MDSKFMKKLILFITLVAMVLLFVCCDGDSPTSPTTTTTSVPLRAQLDWVSVPSINNGGIYISTAWNLCVQGSIRNSGNGTAYESRIKFLVRNSLTNEQIRQRVIYCNPRTISAGQTIANIFNLGSWLNLPNTRMVITYEFKWRNPSGGIETSSGEFFIQNISQP
jgi:hypothetical protein